MSDQKKRKQNNFFILTDDEIEESLIANTYEEYAEWYRNQQKIKDELNEKEKLLKQKNRITWNEMYMKIAEIVSQRSKDPHTKVGAVITKDNHILGIGYNAEPKGFTYNFDWNSSEKYNYVIHAELNAIANATYFGNSLQGATIYLTLSPCHECMKLLIQHEIDTIYYKDEYKDFELTKKMANHSKIKLIKFN